MEAVAVHQTEVFQAAVTFARTEGIIIAPETAHAVKTVIDEALRCRKTGEEKVILFNLSGHGNLDLGAYDAYFEGKLSDFDTRTARSGIPSKTSRRWGNPISSSFPLKPGQRVNSLPPPHSFNAPPVYGMPPRGRYRGCHGHGRRGDSCRPLAGRVLLPPCLPGTPERYPLPRGVHRRHPVLCSLPPSSWQIGLSRSRGTPKGSGPSTSPGCSGSLTGR